MSHSELILTVRRAPEGSAALALGAVHVTRTVTVGRSPECDVVVPEPTVSRIHARMERRDQAWWLVNLAKANGVFLDGRELAAGHTGQLPDGPCLIQLGGVILESTPSLGTIPVLEALTVPSDDVPTNSEASRFRISVDGDAAALHLRGKLVTMKPLAVAVLACLAEAPAQVVHEWDVLESVGRDAHIAQAVSEIRRGLRRLVDAGQLDEREVRRWIAEASAEDTPEALAELSSAELMRRLVRSRRGHGYCLAAPAGVFRVAYAG